LETDGAVGEPVELGEIVNEQGFGFGGGLIISFEIGHKRVESCGIFIVDENLAGSEAMFEGVLAGCGFACSGARTAFGIRFGIVLAHRGSNPV
jgi:hypothetical protein